MIPPVGAGKSLCDLMKELQNSGPLRMFVVVQPLSHVRIFATPWTAALQASLSFTIFQSLLKFVSIESVMLSNRCPPLPPSSPFAFNLSQH